MTHLTGKMSCRSVREEDGEDEQLLVQSGREEMTNKRDEMHLVCSVRRYDHIKFSSRGGGAGASEDQAGGGAAGGGAPFRGGAKKTLVLRERGDGQTHTEGFPNIELMDQNFTEESWLSLFVVWSFMMMSENIRPGGS